MASLCNVCTMPIGSVFMIYDKKHCSKRCKDYYRSKVERNLNYGELYYEKKYVQMHKPKPKSKSFPSMATTSSGFFFEHIVRKTTSIESDNLLMISRKVNIEQPICRKRPLDKDDLIEVVIHSPNEDYGENVELRKGYLDKVKDMSMEMISYFRNFMCNSPKLIR
jgi:hypothetical protein